MRFILYVLMSLFMYILCLLILARRGLHLFSVQQFTGLVSNGL
jgi:hypothetical protein